jgi:hypothetical protein
LRKYFEHIGRAIRIASPWKATFAAILIFTGVTGASAQVEDTAKENKVLAVVERIPGLAKTIESFSEYYDKDGIRPNLWVERPPNSNANTAIERKYYSVYVGEDHGDHTVRWYTFLVSKDLKKILYYDVSHDKIYPLSHWKKLWPATKFLRISK